MRESADTFPTDWDTKTIGDIACHVGSGATPTGGSSVYSKTGITFIRSQNVTFKGLLLDDVAFIGTSIHQQMARSEIFTHDVLLNITGASIGRCCFVPQNFGLANVNQHVCAIRLPRPSHEDAVFLAGVLASHIGQSQIDRLNAGGNREGLNYQQVRSFVVPWPRPEERKSIAAILEAADEAIAKTEAVIAKLKQVRAGLLHNLLTRGLDGHGQLRDPIVHPEQFQDSPLGRIPRDWSIQNLDIVVRIIDCKHYTPKFVKEGKAFIRPRNVKPEGLDFSEVDFVSDEDFILLTDKHVPRVGDIVFSRNATFGVACYVDQSIPFAIGQDTVVMTYKSASTHFVYYVLCSHLLEAQIMKVSSGSTFGRINLAFIRLLLVPNPALEEQNAIVEKMIAFDRQVKIEEAQLTKLAKLKSGLMTDLLTGRVRIPEEAVIAS